MAANASCRVLDVRVHRVTLADVLEHVEHWIQDGGTHQIVTVNLDFVRLARTDLEFRTALAASDLAVPDGMGVVWATRLGGDSLTERVAGVDIVEQGAALAAEKGYSIFLLGAEPGVAERAAAELLRRHPGLRIAGIYSPPMGPFSEEEDARMVALVQAARPDMLFVAFGAPRQDLWIYRHRHELHVPVCVGVGGTFNFLAGRVPRAPRWMQSAGLEWAHRLLQNPRRLWRRYIVHDAPIFLRFVAARLMPVTSLRLALLAGSPPLATAGESLDAAA
jgi:N-acetylglucosaminyldiphosphoundecaprenol N-acetyl-beta-D-mannosaminyltransferase